jgi:hypothetical protein
MRKVRLFVCPIVVPTQFQLNSTEVCESKKNKMKENIVGNSTSPANRSSFSLVPDEVLDTLVAKQDRILELLEAKKDATLNGFVTEKQAMQIVKKKATWFWQMRKTGQIPYKKIGKTIYYSVDDLSSLLDNK